MLLRIPQYHSSLLFFFFFFNDTATTEIYTLSLHDALPICRPSHTTTGCSCNPPPSWQPGRSEEHTSELQSRFDLVCRLLLEKKKQLYNILSVICIKIRFKKIFILNNKD